VSALQVTTASSVQN